MGTSGILPKSGGGVAYSLVFFVLRQGLYVSLVGLEPEVILLPPPHPAGFFSFLPLLLLIIWSRV